jgi:hypothetical protein
VEPEPVLMRLGKHLNTFVPADWQRGLPTRFAFPQLKQDWIGTFYPTARKPQL